MVDQRLAGYFNQRLGARRGQRPHPFAEPGRHHHRGLGHRPARDRTDHALTAHAANTSGSPRCEGGTLASNQIATGAITGWAKSRSR
ncbi:hypothetical protein QP185_18120 [Sphingomonas aerolata]|uniref:hypothetical protein n=1 Tax=Sphingomonas aerolata TaxID=185951 RepID=UPI002FE42257